jgi:hypothetical protein
MPRFTVVLLAAALAVVALAPPGLCSCWLLPNVAETHPHPDGKPYLPHSHDYLHELFHSQTAAVVPLSNAPAAVLMLLIALSGRWFVLGSVAASGNGWQPDVLAPPPRPLSSLFPAAV